MKTILKVMAILIGLSSAAGAQVAPAATSGVPVSSRLYYALRYAQSAEFGTGLGSWQTSNLSGTADYSSSSRRAPFTVEYAGGYTWTIQGPSYGSGLFQHLYLKQSGVWRKWTASVSDDVSYLPQSPTIGFSGIAGIGEPIGTPNPTPGGSQSILTLNTHVVQNIVTGTAENKLTSATSLSGSGGYELLRYPNNDGLDTNTYTATGRLSHRLDGRDSLIGTYKYDLYTYPGFTLSIGTHTGLIDFHRLLSRKLSVDLGAGPLWIDSSNQPVVPSKLTYAVNASAAYTSQPSTLQLGYLHGTNAGAGYLLGATLDSVSGNYSRTVAPNVLFGMTGSYGRTAGLTNNGAIKSAIGGAQATWQINRNFIAFASYTGIFQNSSSVALPANTVNQTLHTIGFGIGYSPRNNHFKQ